MNTNRIIAILLGAAMAFAQDATFSADVKVVNLLVTVRDRDGKVVKNLTKEDFVVLEDGRAQTIKYFAQESNLPLSIGIMVDTSCSQLRVLEAERTASYKFLDQVLRGEDLAFVLHFDFRVSLLQGFTSSREELASAFSKLSMPRHCNTVLYDAIHDASEQLMKARSGRKAYIVLSDGVDVRSKNSIGAAIEFAQRSDTIIYSVFFGLPQVGLGLVTYSRGRATLRRLSDETGGGYFAVSRNKSIEQIYAEIEEELRNQYSIGYSSDATNDKKFRKVALTATRKDLVVRTREGYYPR